MEKARRMTMAKKPTQEDLIFSFLLKNPNARPIEISKTLNILGPSVRRAIFNLREEKILSRPVISGKKRGTVKIRKTKEARRFKELLKKIKPKRKPKEEKEEVEKFIIYKKTLGLTLYCCSKSVNWKAVIFEEEEYPDREDYLRDKLLNYAKDKCAEWEKENLGYEVEEWTDKETIGVPRFERDD
jgi:hypothetical protein